jgi:hypothetical protein
MHVLRLGLVALIACTVRVGAADAEPVSGIWVATIGADRFGIRFAEAGDGMCGIMHWMSAPKTAAGQWKLDSKNPKTTLRQRRLLGLTLLGRLKESGSSSRRYRGRLYIPDPGRIPLVGELDGIACDVDIALPASGRGEASVDGGFGSKCYFIGKAKNPLELQRSDAALPEPTATGAACDYQE